MTYGYLTLLKLHLSDARVRFLLIFATCRQKKGFIFRIKVTYEEKEKVYSFSFSLTMNASPLKQLLSLRKLIHENVSGVLANKIQCERLWERIDQIIDPLERLEHAPSTILSSETRAVLEKLLQCIDDCNKYIERLKAPDRWYEEIYDYQQTEEKLSELNERLCQLSQDLALGINIQELFNRKQDHDDQQNDLKDIKQQLNEIAQKMTEKQCEQHQIMDKMIDKRFQSFSLQFQQNLLFNSDSNPFENNQQFLHIPYKDLSIEYPPLGQGGFADVYKAKWLTHHDVVAMKLIRLTHLSNIREDFYREISTMYRIRYENVLSVLGACVEPNLYAIIVEYMPLGSLADILYRTRVDEQIVFNWADRYSIAWQMAKSINYLHNLNPAILHRDIKSMNFLLKYSGLSEHKYLVKVCDFGLAEIRRETLSQSMSFPSVQLVGSFYWKAPELLSNHQRHTKQSDIYSLGMVFWELATGQKPWDECADETTVFVKVKMGERPTIPDDVPENYKHLIEDAWNHCPEKRPSCFQIMQQICQLNATNDKVDVRKVHSEQAKVQECHSYSSTETSIEALEKKNNEQKLIDSIPNISDLTIGN